MCLNLSKKKSPLPIAREEAIPKTDLTFLMFGDLKIAAQRGLWEIVID